MSATIEHPNFCVIDDFLDEAAWTALWTEFQFMELLPVSRTRGAWKLSDGVPLGGQELLTPTKAELEALGDELEPSSEPPRRYPSGTAIDAVLAALLEHPELHSGLIEPSSWARISARAYVYPRNTGLSWHADDHALYAGAFIYYAHPHWNAHWGGELLIAEHDAEDDLPIMGYRFETEGISGQLMDMGCGNFVMPRPNRLVILAGAPHMIARVSPAAGEAVRASVSGFFLRSPDPGAEDEAGEA